MDNKQNLPQSSGVNINYHALLMENHIAESNLESSKGIKAVKTSEDFAALFFIDKKGSFKVVSHSADSNSAWILNTLSPDGYEVTAFALYHDESSNQLTLAYARRKNSVSELLVSKAFDLGSVDLNKWEVNFDWANKVLERKERIIDHITMDAQGVLFSTHFKDTDAAHHYFKYPDQPRNYTLPENGEQAQQIALGKAYDQYGVFLLYYIQNNKTLLFQSLEPDEYGEVLQHRLNTGANINNFDVQSNAEGNSVVYTAGNGIFRFPFVDESPETIVPSSDLREYFKIDSAEQGDSASIWVLGKQKGVGGLYYLSNQGYQPDGRTALVERKWTAPLQMHDYVDEFESVRGKNLINQLYLMGQVNAGDPLGLIHFWQDRISTHWHEHYLNIPNINQVRSIDSYTVDIKLETDKVELLVGKTMRLLAEENTALYINNRRRFLIAGQPILLPADEFSFNIVYPTQSLAAPKLRLSADFIDGTLEIDPVKGVMSTLQQKLGSKEGLRNAKNEQGKALLTGTHDDDTLGKVAQSVQELAKVADKVEQKAPQLRSSSVATATTGRDILSVNFATTAPVPTSFIDNAANALGDLFHSLKKGFVELIDFVVSAAGEAYRFVVKIGNAILDFIVETAKAVVAFAEKVFEKIKVFFKNLYEFLAFLFNWDDILETKNTLKAYTLNMVDSFKNNIAVLQDYVDKVLQDIQNNVRDQLEYDKIQDARSTAKSAGNDSRNEWVNSKKSYVAQSQSSGGGLNIPEALRGGLSDTFQKLLPYFQKYPQLLSDTFKGLGEKIMSFFKGEINIADLLKYLALSLADIGLEIVRDILHILFEGLKAAVGLVRDLLAEELEIPFFSALYKKISGSGLSLIDVICLLIAIPATVMYKIGEGDAPFKKVDKQKFIESGKTAFELKLSF